MRWWYIKYKMRQKFSRKYTIKYSLDKKLYYIVEFATEGRVWMSSDKLAEAEAHKETGWMSGGIDITKTDGEAYSRCTYPFAFWKVKSGNEEKISKDDDKVLDYMAYAYDRTHVEENRPND